MRQILGFFSLTLLNLGTPVLSQELIPIVVGHDNLRAPSHCRPPLICRGFQCRPSCGAVLRGIIPCYPEAVTLAWKFQPGQTFFQEFTTDASQTMKVMGSDIQQKQSQTFIFSWIADKQEGDRWVLKQKIEGVKTRIEIGGQLIEYDSTKEVKAANLLVDIFKNLVGCEFRLTLDKNLKVIKIEGWDVFLKNRNQANPQMETLLKQIVSEDALKEWVNSTFVWLPPKPIILGESWEDHTINLDLGPIGRFQGESKFIYEGKDKEKPWLDRIRVETTVKHHPPDARANGLPFKIKKSPLSGMGSGFILFNNEQGWMEEGSQKVDLGGELVIEIGDQETLVSLTQNQVTTSHFRPHLTDTEQQNIPPLLVCPEWNQPSTQMRYPISYSRCPTRLSRLPFRRGCR